MAVVYRTIQRLFRMGINEVERPYYFPPGEPGKLVSMKLWCVDKNSMSLRTAHRGIILVASDRRQTTTGVTYPGDSGFIGMVTLGIQCTLLDGGSYVNAHEAEKAVTWLVSRAPVWPEEPMLYLIKDNANQEEIFGVELVVRVEQVSELEQVQARYGTLTK